MSHRFSATQDKIRRALIVTVGRRLRAVALRIAFPLCPRRTVLGIEVIRLTGDLEPGPLFTKVESALQLIADCDPGRFARIRRNVRRIILLNTPEPGGLYWHELRSCVLDIQYVILAPVEFVAGLVVHEATHARLRSADIGYPPAYRSRIERLCNAEEIRFASRLPDGAQLTADASERQAGYMSVPGGPS